MMLYGHRMSDLSFRKRWFPEPFMRTGGRAELQLADILSIADAPERAIDAACSVLARGDLLGLPTETVYGLAADATNGEAVARIYAAKGRPRFNPLICHMSDRGMAEAHVRFEPLAEKLADAFWPGPLTLVLPRLKQSPVASLVTAGLDTLAVRVPLGIAGAIIQTFGRPIAAPSANRSGRISPTRAEHVAHDLGDAVSLVLDAGPCAVGLESTIVKVESGRAILLRPGGLSRDEIEAVTGHSLLRHETPGVLEAPGMMASHYAPDAPVRLNVTSVAPSEVLIDFADQPIIGKHQARAVIDLSPSGRLTEAAAQLFDAMQRADRLGGSAIVFAPIPTTGLGEAINDRLQRAAAPRGVEPHAGTQFG